MGGGVAGGVGCKRGGIPPQGQREICITMITLKALDSGLFGGLCLAHSTQFSSDVLDNGFS